VACSVILPLKLRCLKQENEQIKEQFKCQFERTILVFCANFTNWSSYQWRQESILGTGCKNWHAQTCLSSHQRPVKREIHVVCTILEIWIKKALCYGFQVNWSKAIWPYIRYDISQSQPSLHSFVHYETSYYDFNIGTFQSSKVFNSI